MKKVWLLLAFIIFFAGSMIPADASTEADGWDQKFGGWYTELRNNKPTVPTKDLFDETYANLGAILYYYATADQRALGLVEKAHYLIKKNAWDKKHQGYFGIVNRDWSV